MKTLSPVVSLIAVAVIAKAVKKGVALEIQAESPYSPPKFLSSQRRWAR